MKKFLKNIFNKKQKPSTIISSSVDFRKNQADKLSKLIGLYFKDIKMHMLIPWKIENVSFTFFSEENEPFTLNKVESFENSLQPTTEDKKSKRAMITRQIIPESYIEYMIHNPQYFNFYFSLLLNGTLTKIHKELISVSNRTFFYQVTFNNDNDSIEFRMIVNNSNNDKFISTIYWNILN